MKVLLLHTRYRLRGGEDAVVEAEAGLLDEAGHDVRQVIASNPDTPLASVGALSESLWNPGWERRVGREVVDFVPDVAHIHNTWLAMSPSVIRSLNRAGVPVVMTLHNYRLTCANGLLFRDGAICEECVGTSPWNAVKYGCYRESRFQSAFAAGAIAIHQRLGTWVDGVDRFLALTSFQKDVMVRAGLPIEKITVKPNFVPDSGSRLAPPSESNVILYVGRLSVEKGVDRLLDAWNRADTGDLELWVVGDGPLRQVLERDAPPGVQFLGARPHAEAMHLMRTARACVIPSKVYEGLSLVLIESFAAGTPVLAGGHGPFRGLISDGPGASWLVGDASADSWARSITRLLDDVRCDLGGLRARARYDAYFTPAANLQQLEEVYSYEVAKHLNRTNGE